VLTVTEDDSIAETPMAAWEYLEHRGVHAAFIQAQGNVSAAILATARARACDLIIMGGYEHTAVVEAVLGSAIDHVLQESDRPMLICR